MWRALGDGEFYTYLPPNPANEKECTVAPQSECNPKFGASVGRGAFRFTTNAWTTVTQRVRLNDVGEANGEIELWANGQSVINVSGLVLRSDPAARIRGIMFQTFFGGVFALTSFSRERVLKEFLVHRLERLLGKP